MNCFYWLKKFLLLEKKGQNFKNITGLNRRLLRSVDDNPDEPSASVQPSEISWREEEQASLQQSLRNLQTQFAAERAHRVESECEAELLARENAALEQQVARMEGCQVGVRNISYVSPKYRNVEIFYATSRFPFQIHQARIAELEHEVEELRLLWKSESSSRSTRPEIFHSLLPSFLSVEAESEGEAVKTPLTTKCWDSDSLPIQDPSLRIYDHECSCVRRAEVVKYRGISLLNEVDAQYSALQAKYDELLQRCHLGPQEEAADAQSHKSVQTASPATGCPVAAELEDFEEDFHQPEYKELFREIFSRIQKTKEDLIENRERASGGEVPPN